ncbi:MAG: DUF2262 domain-containing protein [Acidobacteriota bacterium]
MSSLSTPCLSCPACHATLGPASWPWPGRQAILRLVQVVWAAAVLLAVASLEANSPRFPWTDVALLLAAAILPGLVAFLSLTAYLWALRPFVVVGVQDPASDEGEGGADELFADLNHREARFMEQLGASAESLVTGHVDEPGTITSRFGSRTEGSAQFELTVWRIDSGPLRTDSLTVRRMVTDDEADSLREAISPGSLLKVRARVAEENIYESPQALLEEVVETDVDDGELRATVAALKPPEVHEDDQFGTLTFDRRLRQYSADASWNGRPVELGLEASTPEELAEALQAARALWDDSVAWERRVLARALEELLSVRNGGWLDEGEAETTPEEFGARMTLELIRVDPDGNVSFSHDDGDLFWGHAISVDGNLSGGPKHAGISG